MCWQTIGMRSFLRDIVLPVTAQPRTIAQPTFTKSATANWLDALNSRAMRKNFMMHGDLQKDKNHFFLKSR